MAICKKIYEKWMLATQEKKIKVILSKLNPNGLILDVGCGPGVLEKYLNTIALDVNEDYLKGIKGKRVKGSGNAIPFKSNVFDWVFCIDTIHLLKNAGEMIRVLKKHGKLVVSIFCNEHNLEEKKKYLKSFLKDLEIVEEFLIKTEKEWDFVVIARKSFHSSV